MGLLHSCFCIKKIRKERKNFPNRFIDNKTIEQILEESDIPDSIAYVYNYETNNYFYIVNNFNSSKLNITKYKKRIMLEYVPNDEINEQNICPICIEETLKNESIVKMNVCNHHYHKNCALACLENKEECAICRANINNDILMIHKQKCVDYDYDYDSDSQEF